MKKLSKILLLSVLSIFLMAGSAMALPLGVPDIDFNTFGSISHDTNADGTYTGYTYGGTTYNTHAIAIDNKIRYDDNWPSPAYDMLSGTGHEVKMNLYFNVDNVGKLMDETGVMIELVTLGEVKLTHNPGDDRTYNLNDVLLTGTITKMYAAQSGSNYDLDFIVPTVTGKLVDDSIWPNIYPTGIDSFLENQSTPDWSKDFATGPWKGDKAPVPEPATMLLLGSGLIGLAAFSRKKFFKK